MFLALMKLLVGHRKGRLYMDSFVCNKYSKVMDFMLPPQELYSHCSHHVLLSLFTLRYWYGYSSFRSLLNVTSIEILI